MADGAGLRFTDAVLIFATLMGPVLAVQAQKWIERAREAKSHKQWIFHTLMATRSHSGRTTPDHVRALNSITLAFSKNNKKEKKVVLAWESYLNNLSFRMAGASENELLVWSTKGDDLFFELLRELSGYLRYDFSDVDIKSGLYVPTAFTSEEEKMNRFRDGIIKVLSGDQPVSMKITEFPIIKEAYEHQIAVQKAVLEAVHNGVLHVKVDPSGEGGPNSQKS